MKRVVAVAMMVLIASTGCYAGARNFKKNNSMAVTKNIGITVNQKKVSPTVTFVELGSVNCMPCRMMQPIMAAIEKEYAETVKVVFYDVWTESGKAKGIEYRVRVIPTQIFLDEKGQTFFRHEGFFSKEEIVKILKTKGL